MHGQGQLDHITRLPFPVDLYNLIASGFLKDLSVNFQGRIFTPFRYPEVKWKGNCLFCLKGKFYGFLKRIIGLLFSRLHQFRRQLWR